MIRDELLLRGFFLFRLLNLRLQLEVSPLLFLEFKHDLLQTHIRRGKDLQLLRVVRLLIQRHVCFVVLKLANAFESQPSIPARAARIVVSLSDLEARF